MSLKTICTIVGARPQFMKASPVSRAEALTVAKRQFPLAKAQAAWCPISVAVLPTKLAHEV